MSPRRFSSARGLEAVALLLFGLACAWVASWISRTTDVDVFDEADALARALREEGLPNADMSPLYVLWYRTLALLRPDPLRLFPLHVALTVGLVPFLLALLLRWWGVGTSLSLVVGWAWLVSGANLDPGVRSCSLVLAVALAGALVARCCPVPWKLCSLTTSALLASLVRPEYVLAFSGMACLSLGWALRARPRGWRQAVPLAWPLVLATGAFAILGTPGLGSHGARAFLAFGQHFSLRWASRYGAVDPWRQWQEVVASTFGPVASPWDAFVAEPLTVARHVGSNLADLPRHLGASLGWAWGPPQPPWGLPGTAVLLALAAKAILDRRTTLGAADAVELAALGLWAVPGILSALLLFPRTHYLVLPAAMGLVTLAVLGKGPRPDSTRWGPVGLSAVLLAASLGCHPPRGGTPNATTASFLATLGLRGDVFVRTTVGNVCTYAGPGFHCTPLAATPRATAEALADPSTTVLVVAEDLLPPAVGEGWRALPVPGTGRVVLLRATRLPDPPETVVP